MLKIENLSVAVQGRQDSFTILTCTLNRVRSMFYSGLTVPVNLL